MNYRDSYLVSLRTAIEADTAAQGVFAKRLGLRLWNDHASALARMVELGAILESGIADHEQDTFRRVKWTPLLGPGAKLETGRSA